MINQVRQKGKYLFQFEQSGDVIEIRRAPCTPSAIDIEIVMKNYFYIAFCIKLIVLSCCKLPTKSEKVGLIYQDSHYFPPGRLR